MPVFEYKCKNCNTKYEVYHKSSTSSEKVVCPDCHSEEREKLFSSFSASVDVSHSHASEAGCASGMCGYPGNGGGCASGMCGLN